MTYVPHSLYLWASTACYGDNFTILYVNNGRTAQETHLWALTACYRDRFTFLYVDDARTAQETHLWASTAWYGDSVTLLYVAVVRTSQDLPIGLPRPVTGIVLMLYVGYVCISQETRLQTSKACY
jgi:hypothetical protein